MEVTAIMKEKMNVGELRRYYEGRSPKRILYCTENQVWDKVENPLRANLAFTSILMMSHPNVICLRNGDSTICFERVKYVYVDAERSPLGTVLDIICGDKADAQNDRRYTVITL